MTAFLRDLFSKPGVARTVIVMDPDTLTAPRQYEVRPGYALYGAVIGTVLLAALLITVLVLTPLRGLLVGPGASALRTEAEANARRAEALEDSVMVQAEQIEQLRAMIVGDGAVYADSAEARPEARRPADEPPAPAAPPSGRVRRS